MSRRDKRERHNTAAGQYHTHEAPPVEDATPRPEAPPAKPPPPSALVRRPTEMPMPQAAPVIRCAFCRAVRVVQTGIHGGWRYYRCQACCDLEQGRPSTFKVQVTDPLR